MGGYSQVLYQQELTRVALAYEQPDFTFDRFVIITGQDFPLVSNREMIRRYETEPQRLWIKGLNKTLYHKSAHKSFTVYHFCRDWSISHRQCKRVLMFAVRKLMTLIPIRKKPYIAYPDGTRWDVWQASGYMSLTHDAVAYILHQLDTNTILTRYFRYSYVPEEFVIPTILFNSPFSDHAAVYEHKRYDGLISISALEHFEYTSAIKVFTEADYDELTFCSKMFARKLETGKSDELMDMIDKNVLNKQ